jgi:S-DNA-T family DNA segregation ATPase FtsK/SpoIIIE
MSASHTPDDNNRHGGEVVPIDTARRDRRPALPEDTAPVPASAAAPVPASAAAPEPWSVPPRRVLEGTVIGRPAMSASMATVIRVIATPDNARRVRRHGGYVAAGMGVTARRWRDSSTTASYQRWMRMAEATGNHEQAREWEARLAVYRKERHARRMEWLSLPVKVALMLPKVAIGGSVALGGTGVLLAIATKNIRNVVLPVEFVAHVTDTLYVVVSTAWGPVMMAAPFAALAALWHAGRKHALSGGMPGWAATAAEADRDIAIDESTIARALQALNIKQINDYLKDGLPLQFLVPCRESGRGTHFVIRLPAGVPAERIAKRRADVATGLFRQAKEVWLTTGDEAGILDGWIANKGALAEGAGAYPLLDGGFCDFFKPVPFGKTLRGDPIGAPLAERNTITGGMPGQGKSSAARVIMAGAALDPSAELMIWVPDTNFDFEAFRPRCSRYVMGAEDDQVAQILADLRELKAEVQARGERLVRHGVPAVTRELASAGVGLHPIVALLEEAHLAIQHKEHGKEIAELLIYIVKLGRKRAIHLVVSTQAPTADSMPRDVTRNCSNGIAFAVGDHTANDGLLGQGAYSAGHRATELIPGTDRGTALVKGFSGERSQVVQVYFLDVAKGSDQVTPLIERSLAEIARRGRAVPGTERERPAIESRDLLGDLDAVLGDDGDPVRLSHLPALLQHHAPDWTAYQSLTGRQLAELLDTEGVRITNTGNVPRLDPADLRRVLADRDSDASE